MSYGPVKVFSGAIASGASTASSIDLGAGWSRVFLQVGTMSTNAALDVYASTDGSDFRQVFERVNTAPVQYQSLTVATNAVGGVFPIDVSGQYLQFRASAVISGGCSIKVICT